MSTAPTINGTPAPSARAIAEKMIGMGSHVIIFPRGQKATRESGWQNEATRDLSVIEEKTKVMPYGNVGVVGKLDGNWFFDDDGNILAEYEALHGKIQTYRARSVSGGTHLYFKQSDLSRAMGNINGVDAVGSETWSARVNNRYVVAAGSSAHPGNDLNQPEVFYQAIENIAVTEAPESFIKFLKSKVDKKRATTANSPLQLGVKIARGGIHNYMLAQAGRLRNMNVPPDVLESTLLALVHENCEGPIDDQKVKAMAKSILNYPPGQRTDLILSQDHVASVNQAGKRLNVQGAGSVTTKKIRWIWPGRVPFGKLTLFVGVPGCGKSLATVHVASRLSMGADFYDAPNLFEPSETLMLVGEDDVEDTTTPRLIAAGADLSKIHFLRSVIVDGGKGETQQERELQFDLDLAQVEDYLKENPSVRLLVVDPISNYLGSARMFSDQEIRTVLIPLKNLAERQGVALIAVMHLNKKSDASAINRVGGSMAFIGVARVAYLFSEIENEQGQITDQQYAMVLMKANIVKKSNGLTYEIPARPVQIEGSPESIPYLKFTGETTKNADGLLQPKNDFTGRPPVEANAAKDWLSKFLADGPQSTKDIIKAADEMMNFSERTVKRAKTSLPVESTKVGKNWVWSLQKLDLNATNNVTFAQPEPELTSTKTQRKTCQTTKPRS